MHILDVLIIFLLVGFGVGGIRRGFLFELMITIGLAVSLFLTLYFRGELQALAGKFAEPGWELRWASGLMFLLFFLIIYLVFAYMGNKLHQWIDGTKLKWPDRILGLAGGTAKGIFLLAALVMVIQWADVSGQMTTFMNKSKLIRVGKKAVHSLTHWESWEKRNWV
ncbi:MAG: CvpA family protein [Calditrichaeota bacterium]|nr:CvpA family protein [Calditrichota bacterium]MCB9369712.1 CvpA family protein [Calditrichota bacterium]